MKLAQFKAKQSEVQRLGLMIDAKLFDVFELAKGVKRSGRDVALWLLQEADMSGVIARRPAALDDLNALAKAARAGALLKDESACSLDSIEFQPAVYPGKILAIGRNYVDHAIEGGAAPPEAPLIFNKLPNSLSAHNAPIVLPTISTQVDYEAELAVVIGRKAKRVSEAEALEYVFGYTLINDVSARDLQLCNLQVQGR